MTVVMLNEDLRARHIEGHAFAGSCFKFPVRKLAIDGLSREDLKGASDCWRVDDYTLLQVPYTTPEGTLDHALCMRSLMRIAFMGPTQELLSQEREVSVKSIAKFKDDWAWVMHGLNFQLVQPSNQSIFVEDEIGCGKTFLAHKSSGMLIERIAKRLVKNRVINEDEMEEILEAHEAEMEEEAARPIRRSRRFSEKKAPCGPRW